MTSLKKVENSQLKKELSIEEKISYIQYISDNYKNEKSLYKAMAKNTMKLVFTKGFGGKDLDNQTIQEINRVYVALKDLTINNTYNLVSDSTIQKESKSFVYNIYYCKNLTKDNYNNRKQNSHIIFTSNSKEEILKFIKEEVKKLNTFFKNTNNVVFEYLTNINDFNNLSDNVLIEIYNKNNAIKKERFGGLSKTFEHQIWNEYFFETEEKSKKINQGKSTKFCFQNGNLVLPFKKALVTKYSFKDIADILNISCQEVCSQFNQMVKESGYRLFN